MPIHGPRLPVSWLHEGVAALAATRGYLWLMLALSVINVVLAV